MNVIHFTGRLAAAPDLSNHASGPRCTLRVIRNQFGGKDKETGENREKQVAIPWVVFGPRAEAIARNFYKGDQIIITGHVENNDYIPKDGTEDDRVYTFQFLIDEFDFGAPGPEKRTVLNRERQERERQGQGRGRERQEGDRGYETQY